MTVEPYYSRDEESEFIEECWACGGEGWVSRYEDDPLWYDEDDLYPCSICNGTGAL